MHPSYVAEKHEKREHELRLAKKKCRCCGLEAFERCGPRMILPFFAKFALHLSITARSNSPSTPGALDGFSFYSQIEYGACSIAI